MASALDECLSAKEVVQSEEERAAARYEYIRKRLSAETPYYDFDLFDTFDNERLERVVTPEYKLPASIHTRMLGQALLTQQYRSRRWRVSAKSRMFVYLPRIVGTAKARIVENLEKNMFKIEYAFGGKDKEIFMSRLFVMAQREPDAPIENGVVNLFTEMLEAAEVNKRAGFANLRVHGLLFDTRQFHFYSYNPISGKFAFDSILDAEKNLAPNAWFEGMVTISDKIFSIILDAYINGLEVSLSKSKGRDDKGNISPIDSGLIPSKTEPEPPRDTYQTEPKSTASWENALALAVECRENFQKPAASVEELETNSNAALLLLAQSVRSMRSIGCALMLTDQDDPITQEELKDLFYRIMREKYEARASSTATTSV